MSDLNLFVTSSQTTAVFDSVTLTDWSSNPPQKYWVIARPHSLVFYQSEFNDEDHDNESSITRRRKSSVGYVGRPNSYQPYFSSHIYADIQRIDKWAPPPFVKIKNPELNTHECDTQQKTIEEGLLLLTESSVLHLVYPDYKTKRLHFISRIALTVVRNPNKQQVEFFYKAVQHRFGSLDKPLFLR